MIGMRQKKRPTHSHFRYRHRFRIDIVSSMPFHNASTPCPTGLIHRASLLLALMMACVPSKTLAQISSPSVADAPAAQALPDPMVSVWDYILPLTAGAALLLACIIAQYINRRRNQRLDRLISSLQLPEREYPVPDDFLMNFIMKMFGSHGAKAFRLGHWIVVDRGKLFVRAAQFDHRQHPNNLILQADFVCLLPSGQHIVEPFAGIGADERSAVLDACNAFGAATFHAWFVTLLGRPCDHVERETWTIGGIPRILTFGSLLTRGQFPLDQWPPVFAVMQAQIEALPLSAGLHWCRLFYFHTPGGSPTIEALMDNKPCQPLISAATELPWPPSDEFYSARLFFTIQDAPP